MSTVKNDRVNYLNGCNMIVHRDYANKACPGKYLYDRHGDIATKVNVLLGATTDTVEVTVSPTSSVLYRIRKTWADSKTQKGAFSSLKSAQKCADQNPDYSVFDANGKAVYAPESTASGPSLPYRIKISAAELNIRKGAVTGYATNGSIKDKGVYTIMEERAGKGSTKGWGRLKSEAGWISLDYCTKL